MVRWLKSARLPSRLNLPLAVFLCAMLLYALGIGWLQTHNATAIEAKQGFLNCSSIDNRAPAMLRGEWEYYENVLLFPSDFSENPKVMPKNTPKPQYISVPGSAPNDYGFGTYRLNFRMVTYSDIFAIKTTDIWSSTRIYLDGKLVCTIGDPSTMSNASLPWNSSQFVIFPMDVFRTNHEIIVQVSNYDYYRMGIANPIHFGTQLEVYKLSNGMRLSEAIFIISVFILAALLLCLLILRIQMGNIPYLLLFSLTFGFHLLLSGEKLVLNLFEVVNYVAYTRISLALHGLMGLFMGLYVCDFIESGKRWAWVRRAGIALSLGLTLSLQLGQQSWQRALFMGSLLVMALWGALSAWFLLRRLLRRDVGALLQMLGLCCWGNVFVVYELYSRGLLSTQLRTSLLTCSIIGFVLLQLIYMAQLVSRVYSGNERLAQRMVISDKLKGELMEIASHELRTPLHGIINITQSAIASLNREEALQSKRPSDELALVLDLARRMRSIVGDLYSFVDMSSKGSAARHPTSLLIEVNAVFEMFEYTGANPSVRFLNRIGRDAGYVYADESKLWQVLVNLMGNAIKYTKAGTITVLSRREGDVVRVSVTDTGIGMPESAREVVFERFNRLREGMEQAGGSGLGLYIARRLVVEMGGSIFVEWSKPGVGSSICFTLPVCEEREFLNMQAGTERMSSAEPRESALLDVPSPMRPAHARLLIADDNQDNLQVLRKIFEDCNFEIDTAYDGQQALEAVQNDRKGYDMVVLDVMMPRMSGFEACRLIRAQHSHFELPILMLTARDQTRDIITGFWAGANDYVAKPADSYELRARVFTLISLRQSVALAIENELSFLQAQIKPHFLYNAFNTISAIALSDGPAASELIDDLGVYLRGCFQGGEQRRVVPLSSELELVNAYLRIEKARFGERLIVEERTEAPGTLNIPSLIIQPLVENAVRHGSLGSYAPLTVRVSTRVEGEDLVIEVSDDGKGMDTESTDPPGQHETRHGSGIGLSNINRRLKLYFNRELILTSRPGLGTTAQMRLPVART